MKKRKIIICIVILLLAAAWTWRYITLNARYADDIKSEVAYFQAGEPVPFEDDKLDFKTPLNGYHIRVDGYEITDYEAFLAEEAIDIERTDFDPDKLALVRITLINEDCATEESGINLTDMKLVGQDQVLQMDWDILVLANPALQGSIGVRLSPGTQYSFVLPYILDSKSFGFFTWKNIEEYEFYLQATSFPTAKCIWVQ